MRYSDSQSQNLLANKALHGLQLGRFASLLEALSVKVLSRSSPSNWFISNKSTVYLSLPNERLSLPLILEWIPKPTTGSDIRSLG